jgi:acetylornithine deacetylase/succinyl-diaminopimelate desuccinylase-like protein
VDEATVSDTAARIIAAVDTDRALELVQQVCRIPSVLGEEGELADFLASVMADSGFEAVELQPVLPHRPNAIGEVDFGPGRRVVMTGHMDTKPVSRGWTVTDPFSVAVIE